MSFIIYNYFKFKINVKITNTMETQIESFAVSGNKLLWVPKWNHKQEEECHKKTKPLTSKKNYYSRVIGSLSDTRSVDVLVPESIRFLKKKNSKRNINDLLNDLSLKARTDFETFIKEKEIERESEMLRYIREEAKFPMKHVPFRYFLNEAKKRLEKSVLMNKYLWAEELQKKYGNNWKDIIIKNQAQIDIQNLINNYKIVNDARIKKLVEELKIDDPRAIAWEGVSVDVLQDTDGDVYFEDVHTSIPIERSVGEIRNLRKENELDFKQSQQLALPKREQTRYFILPETMKPISHITRMAIEKAEGIIRDYHEEQHPEPSSQEVYDDQYRQESSQSSSTSRFGTSKFMVQHPIKEATKLKHLASGRLKAETMVHKPNNAQTEGMEKLI